MTTTPIRSELRALSRLALPVAASQVGLVTLWVVDMMMVGRVSVEALDTAALGRLWIIGTMMFAMGLVMGIDPIMTQAHGAGDGRRVGLTLQRGLVMACLAGVPLALLWLLTDRFLLASGQDPQLSAGALDYVLVQIPGIPAFLAFVVLRQYLLARGIAAPPLWVTVAANGVNVLVNWLLVYGNAGFPELGAVGAGIATALTQIFMAAGLALWIVVFRLHRGAWFGWTRAAWSVRGLLEVWRFGWPVGLMISLELWAVVATNLFAGWLGTIPLAAHSIVMNLASISFMVPLGISFGVVTRVGNLIGAGNRAGAQRAAWVGVGLGTAVMSVSAVTFAVARHGLPRLYTLDSQTIAAAAALLPIAAAFQLADGAQVVGGGVLRGMGRTRPAAWFNLIAYYALALPAAWWLAFRGGQGLAGIWWGLTLGIGVVAVLLLLWIGRFGPAHVDSVLDDLGRGHSPRS